MPPVTCTLSCSALLVLNCPNSDAEFKADKVEQLFDFWMNRLCIYRKLLARNQETGLTAYHFSYRDVHHYNLKACFLDVFIV